MHYEESGASRDSLELDKWSPPELQLEDETMQFERYRAKSFWSSSLILERSGSQSVVENDYSSIKTYKEFQATFKNLSQNDNDNIVDDDSWDGSQGGDYSSQSGVERNLLRTVTSDFGRGAGYLWGKAKKSLSQLKEESDGNHCYVWLSKAWYSIPFVKTMKVYKKSYVLKDMAAGITEGIMNIPLGESIWIWKLDFLL